MAEIGKGVNAGKLASNVQKRITRAQEKMMQKLGKADETKDTAFEEEVTNFNKQMLEGTKLQRDLKTYLAAVKTMHECSKRLQDCLADMYEPDWFGKEEMDALAEEMIEKEMDNNLEDTDVLWTDFHQKLVDSAVINMDNYMAQFPDIKARIAKRERKLVDFDSARHHFASIQKSKKKDEAKIAKPLALMEKAAPGWAQGIITAHQIAQTNLTRNQAEEDLGRAQKVFEEINYDLQEELPALWNSRIGLYVTTFQSVAGLEEKFHRDMGKLNLNLVDIMTKLEEQRQANEAAPNHNLTMAESESDTTTEAPKPRPAPPGPPVQRPPRPSPVKEAKQDIINLFEDALVPNINVPQPSQQSDGPKAGSLLDMDLDAMQAISTSPDPKVASEDSWEPEQTLTADTQWDSDEEAPADAQTYEQPSWEDQGSSYVKPYEAPSWDDDDGGGGAPAAVQPYEAPGWEDHTPAAQAETEAGQPDWDNEEEGDWGEEGAQTDAAATTLSNAATTVTNGSSDAELPSGVLYKVKALHDYAATDSDELDLKSGDIVLVLPFDNPDEQDDGWLLGVKESNWLQNKDLTAKGVFPENFTQRL
uniref:Myc box-dependent-interacting protein 1 n=1 Tax=Astyanax mexicanus TaxID=7994 RepID=A0A3B1JWV1_ASTMX